MNVTVSDRGYVQTGVRNRYYVGMRNGNKHGVILPGYRDPLVSGCQGIPGIRIARIFPRAIKNNNYFFRKKYLGGWACSFAEKEFIGNANEPNATVASIEASNDLVYRMLVRILSPHNIVDCRSLIAGILCMQSVTSVDTFNADRRFH